MNQAPYELTVTFPVWQWEQRHAMEWAEDFLAKVSKLSVNANGGGLPVAPATAITVRPNPEFQR